MWRPILQFTLHSTDYFCNAKVAGLGEIFTEFQYPHEMIECSND